MIGKLPTRPLGSTGLEITPSFTASQVAAFAADDGRRHCNEFRYPKLHDAIAAAIRRAGAGAGPSRPMQVHLAAAS
jgi:hypothetical protein